MTMWDVNMMNSYIIYKRHILIMKTVTKTNYVGFKYIIIWESDDQNLTAVINF